MTQPGHHDTLRAYDIDAHVAEVYDTTETQVDDVRLLKVLLGDTFLRILEPFCGNGRIMLPLARAGHSITGIDKAGPMLESAREKRKRLPVELRGKIQLTEGDVAAMTWPTDFDLVILGANCLYELATAEEQEWCIAQARQALKPGGNLFLDNNHMEGPLDPSWCEPVTKRGRFPTGTCRDGTRMEGTSQTVWFDRDKRLVQFQRTVTITYPDQSTVVREWVEQKHPPSTGEMQAWLAKYGFRVKHCWGDRRKSVYRDDSPRAIFWAMAPR